ncbi:HNH endonuclease [Candidatus Dojkabacteria bacterium]|jgi:hypothetical protein|nr:HNH endonuclease [Candidatus Dojkabacteria bacterium]
MKICWDTLEKVRFIKSTGNFHIGSNLYIERECVSCSDTFLGKSKSKYCTNCVFISKEYRNNNSKSKMGENNPMYNKTSPNSKGGYYTNNISTYDNYAHQLEPYEQCRRNDDDPNILEVKCTYCGKWYVPSILEANRRVKGIDFGKYMFYCSDDCKRECPIFGRRKYYKGQEGHNSREVQPELRQLTFTRDDYICIKCGSPGPLHCHHIYPVATNPIESADVDNCITLCVDCHKKAHKIPGCGYNELGGCSSSSFV